MEITVKIEYKNTRLKELREKAGMSQSQLAAASGMSTRMLQNYEQGVRNLNGAKLLTLLQLCQVLGCTLQDLVTDPQAIELLNQVYPAK